jgi:hypothetical protein
MNDNNSVTGSSGSCYISHGSYKYTIDIPDPPTIFIEWSPSFSDKTDTDTTVDTIQREDILDTASKPICTTYYKQWCNREDHLFLPGKIFRQQGLLYASHLHHPKATELIHHLIMVIIVVAVSSIVIN